MFQQSPLYADPRMCRERDSQSLNGEWSVVFDPDNRGKAEGWYKSFPKDNVPIQVPGVWEQVRPGYDGVGW